MAKDTQQLLEKLDILEMGYADLIDELVRLGLRSAQDADAMKASIEDELADIRAELKTTTNDENEETNESNS